MVYAADELVLPLPFQTVHDFFGQISADPCLHNKTTAIRREVEARIGKVEDDGDDGEVHNEAEDHGAANVHTVSKSSCLRGYKAVFRKSLQSMQSTICSF